MSEEKTEIKEQFKLQTIVVFDLPTGRLEIHPFEKRESLYEFVSWFADIEHTFWVSDTDSEEKPQDGYVLSGFKSYILNVIGGEYSNLMTVTVEHTDGKKYSCGLHKKIVRHAKDEKQDMTEEMEIVRKVDDSVVKEVVVEELNTEDSKTTEVSPVGHTEDESPEYACLLKDTYSESHIKSGYSCLSQPVNECGFNITKIPNIDPDSNVQLVVGDLYLYSKQMYVLPHCDADFRHYETKHHAFDGHGHGRDYNIRGVQMYNCRTMHRDAVSAWMLIYAVDDMMVNVASGKNYTVILKVDVASRAAYSLAAGSKSEEYDLTSAEPQYLKSVSFVIPNVRANAIETEINQLFEYCIKRSGNLYKYALELQQRALKKKFYPTLSFVANSKS